jgi:hypothetical protein
MKKRPFLLPGLLLRAGKKARTPSQCYSSSRREWMVESRKSKVEQNGLQSGLIELLRQAKDTVNVLNDLALS